MGAILQFGHTSRFLACVCSIGKVRRSRIILVGCEIVNGRRVADYIAVVIVAWRYFLGYQMYIVLLKLIGSVIGQRKSRRILSEALYGL